ncbi:hypothetical protein GcM1_113003, partial [Golovinomyces cichoracearum]
MSATPSSYAPTSAPSVFAQGIFQKYRLSEIAIADIDEKQFGYIVSDLENATKNLYDEELFWGFKQDFDGYKRSHFDTAKILRKDLKR